MTKKTPELTSLELRTVAFALIVYKSFCEKGECDVKNLDELIKKFEDAVGDKYINS